MSEIKINLLDSHTTIIGTVHGSVGDRLVAALSAEPETIDELEAAFKRFEKCETIPASSLYRYERCDIDEEPWDAGIMVIDLAARVVACDSTYSLPEPCATVDYHDGKCCTGFTLGYRLPDDWMFVDEINDYLVLWKDRLELRAAVMPLDARPVLYGEPLLNFIIENVASHVDISACRNLPDGLLQDESVPEVRYASACRDAADTQPEENSAPTENEAAFDTDGDQTNPLAKPVVDIHCRWLMTPREDLHGQSPREILFAKQHLIDFDLNSRVNQWSYFLEEPPSLSRDSYAYRYAGFGTHEWVMYYDLVRFLIWEAVDRIATLMLKERSSAGDQQISFTKTFSQGASAATQLKTISTVSVLSLVTELEQLKQQWLSEPRSDLDGYIPAEVIDNERRRRPEAMTGRSMVIDEDCPCCKMMGDESEAGLGIYFCHFDGCDMEDEFAFSRCATLQEWEKEQRQREEWDREWQHKEKERANKIARGEIPEDDFDVPF